jgi:hypothetical protein
MELRIKNDIHINSINENNETNLMFVNNNIEYSVTFQPDEQLFSLEKSMDDKIIYSSENKNHKIIKRVHYIISNINKMKDGQIKTHVICNELEIEILSRYLSKHDILHLVYIESPTDMKQKISLERFRNDKKSYSEYFIRRCKKIEYNKIKKNYLLKIKVCKGFDDLTSSNLRKHKHGINL